MKKAELPKPLRGIIPPMVTPLSERDTLDVAGLEKLVEHILGGGVHGLFVLGTTGEAPGLSYRLRLELIERVCEQVNGRVPVLVGITDTSFVESVNVADHAADAGAAAVVLAPPYYFPANQPELMEYVEHIAAELPLPVFLYNMPSHTKVTFAIETLKRALDIPNVVGLKDSSGQMVYFHEVQQLVKGRPDFSMLVGPEQLLAETVLLGGHGGVCGGANLIPRLYVDLYNASAAGDLPKVRELHDRVMEISVTLYAVGKYGSAFIKGLKSALSCLGICDDVLAEPFQKFAPSERQRVQECLKALKIDSASRTTA